MSIEHSISRRTSKKQLFIHHIFEEQARRCRHQPAVVCGDQQLTYADLERKANQLAHILLDLGVGPESPIALCLPRSVDMIVAILAIFKAGGAYVPLEPEAPPRYLHWQLQHCAATVLLTHSTLLARFEDATCQKLALDVLALHQQNATPPLIPVTSEQAAYIIYTSGSTGNPKGVVITQGNLWHYTHAIYQRLCIDEGWHMAMVSTLAADLGNTMLYASLITGGCLHILPYETILDGTRFAEYAALHPFDVLKIVPSHLQALLQSCTRPSFLPRRFLMLGGEAFPIALLHELRHADASYHIVNHYGPTETTVGALTFQPDAWTAFLDEKTVPIGYPLADVDAYVFDETMRPLPTNAVGELYIGGPGVGRGYLRQADLTAERFVPHPYREGERLYRTGDRVRITAAGALEFLGRIDFQIKVRGFRIELGEIESVLQAHPAVQESVVVVRERASNDKQLVAYLVPASNAQQIGDNTRSWEEEHVEQWQMLYNDLYQSSEETEDCTFNIVGWNSSYTGQPLTADEMREQIEQAVSRILARAPQRLMEIGCGTGLLLFRIAPYAKTYVASDFSKGALRYVEHILATRSLPQVRLSQQAAHEAVSAATETFDAIILNSVVQYFPGVVYLRQVLTEALAVLDAGGFLFVGDVRNLSLHRAYSTSVEFYKALPSLSKGELRQRIQQKLLEEEQLLVDPAFFQLLQRSLPQIGHVQVFLKRGRTPNELTRFRYDVLIRKEATEVTKQASLAWQWGREVESLLQVQTYLQTHAPESLRIQHIPDRRVEEDLQVVNWVFGEHEQETQTVGAFREELKQKGRCGLEPEDIWELGERLGYRVDIFWSDAGHGGVFDVSFQKDLSVQMCCHEPASSLVQEVFPDHLWLKYANNPLQRKITRWVLPQLRDFLKERLPDHMVPAHFVALEHLPLTTNGKIDRKALPAPEEHLLNWQHEQFVEPQTAIEKSLATIWSDLLLRSRISIADNFFELGGHSLMVIQLATRIQHTLQVRLPLKTFFDKPTIAEQALEVERLRVQPEEEVTLTLPGPRQRPACIPAAQSQERLWFLQEMEPEAPFYNVPLLLHLRGELDLAALEYSLNTIIERHEMLRTRLYFDGTTLLQVIDPPHRMALVPLDLAATRDAAQHTSWQPSFQSWVADEVWQPFDLERDALWRARLVRVAYNEHVLVLTFHHTIFDQWSQAVFLNELAALYLAYQGQQAPQPSVLPPLPLQYADYVLWQREQDQDLLAHELAYWLPRLSGYSNVLDLPTDFPRPSVQTSQGASYRSSLHTQLCEDLRTFSRQEGVTLFMTMFAAFNVLLFRYSGQHDMVVGTTTANRSDIHLEALIGFFANTLALRTDLSGQPQFRQLLQQVRTRALEAFSHQNIPLDLLIHELHIDREPNISPLIQCLFVLQNLTPERYQLRDLELSLLDVERKTARMDLIFEIVPQGTSLDIRVEYNCELFHPATIERMVQHYQHILEYCCGHATHRITEFPLLSPTEMQQMCFQWNQTEVPYAKERCYHELFAEQVQAAPDAIALVYEQRCLTYNELDLRSNVLAHRLQAAGVGLETHVGLCSHHTLEAIIALLAILKAGGTYVPLDPAYPPDRLTFMIQDADIRLILTQHGLLEQLQRSSISLYYLDDDWYADDARYQQPPTSAVTGANLAYIIYTSGSTGTPKGVMIPHQGMCSLPVSNTHDFLITAGERVLQFASFNFDASIWEITLALSHGGTLHLVPDDMRMQGTKLVALLDTQAISVVLAAPSVLMTLPDAALPTVKCILAGGEACSAEVVKRWAPGRLFFNAYGPTESSVFASAECCVDLTSRPAIGRPLTNRTIYLLDAAWQPVPIGVPGEVCVGGGTLARGYLNQPEQTAERFIPHPFVGSLIADQLSEAGHGSGVVDRNFKQRFTASEPGDRLYRTGDLARYLPDGRVEFLGRLDQQVKIHGFRIETGEIETYLMQHPAISEALVTAWEDASGDKRLVAYVVCQPDRQESPLGSILRSWLKERVPPYMVPHMFILLDAFPLTPNGKIDRRALPEPQQTEEDAGSATRSLTPLEAQLSKTWQEILHLQHVDIHENFFELGGHSLLAIRIIAQIEKQFATEVPLHLFFQEPTIESIAHYIEQQQGKETPMVIPALIRQLRPQRLPLSLAQQRLWFLYQLDLDNPFYNILLTIRLRGPLVVAWLEAALSWLVKHHEILRTSLQQEEGEPFQRIAAVCSVPLPVCNFQGIAPSLQQRQLALLAQAERSRPFDLSEVPLMRAHLLRLTSDEHVLLLSIHHLIFDGWSHQILIQDLAACYRALALSRPEDLPPVPTLHYADYTLWQRGWLTEEYLQPQLHFWQQRLHDFPAILELPTDFPRPPIQTFRGATVRGTLPDPVARQVRQVAQGKDNTLFMVLLAAFALLLSRLSGQSRVVLGTANANRRQLELEHMLGFFVNTVLVPVDLRSAPAFHHLLQQVRETLLEISAYQDVPFDRLVELMQPARSLSHTPLFQVGFGFWSQRGAQPDWGPLQMERLVWPVVAVKQDLMLDIIETPQGDFHLQWDYNTDLFTPQTIQRWQESFFTLLQAGCQTPESLCARLPLLSPAAWAQQVQMGMGPHLPQSTLGGFQQRIWQQAARQPGQTVLIYGEQTCSYGELVAHVRLLARQLRHRGVGPDVRVGLYCERSLTAIIALLAVLEAGGAYVPLDVHYPRERLAYMCQDAGIALLLTQPALRERVPISDAMVLILDATGQPVGADFLPSAWREPEPLACQIHPDQLAYVIYTSGSTGRPKGVMVSHRGVSSLLDAQVACFGSQHGKRILQFASLSFDASVWELIMALGQGGTLVLAPREQLLPGPALQELLCRQRINTMTLSPSALAALPIGAYPDLECIITAGEACSGELVSRWSPGRAFFNAYGPTETTVCASIARCLADGKRPPIGRPIGNLDLLVLDPAGEALPLGVIGELAVGGIGLARGYLGRPVQTAERFIPHPCKPGERLYRTGDLVRWGADGQLEYLGRLDQQVKLRGHRIELGEIEASLLAESEVETCAVIIRNDVAGGQGLVGYVVLKAEREVTMRQLRQRLRQQLPEYMVPAILIQMASLPITANAKVDVGALPPPVDEEAIQENEVIQPTTSLEQLIAALWCDVLKRERVGIHDNFFDLGGHSLLLTRLQARLQSAFNQPISLTSLFQYATIKDQADYVRYTRDQAMQRASDISDQNNMSDINHRIEMRNSYRRQMRRRGQKLDTPR
ncbi:MAG TPA: amino acid adenylation domain-containing protein [Ktedonosporobacter sp.]|jgi:amino acid adenylation domain-containing protein|nr:amino acid adenylation domain-containing protein [Ktedonosporobacter sp.]